MVCTSTIEPFTIHVADDILQDLKHRLALTRWPDEIPESDWRYGTDLSYLKELVTYWQTGYDWRSQERRLNSFPQYKVQLDDISLHFICQPGIGPNPLPLLMSHGWPGSIYEFIKIIGPLTDPARFGADPRDAFTVVAPSLPGYGFSHEANQRRLSLEEIADLFARLMTDVLGYPRFAAHGGDWGSFITSRLGQVLSQKMAGIHITMVPVAPHPADRGEISTAEADFLKEADTFQKTETGYQWIQGTKPQTLAYGLNDSPVGLAAWILEKFRLWTDCGGSIERRLSKDDLLTNIMIYWVTHTINSSFYLYHQLRHRPWRLGRGEKITTPTGVASFPKEIFRPPREWAERIYNVKRWTPMPSGGHFAALEEPDRLVEDIRGFFRDLR
jgi:pimeloyl-ACP methyl ester carboxylesterase